MTAGRVFAKIHLALMKRRNTKDVVYDPERYRSGHNEAVLKTVCPKGRVGSNPTLSANFKLAEYKIGFERRLLETCLWHVSTAVAFSAEKGIPPSPPIFRLAEQVKMENYPSGEGAPLLRE